MISGVTAVKAKILLVDDLKDNLLALAALLKSDDIEIFQVKSGNDALELMIDHEFALALIDVQMPGMSGFELAELMRGTNRTKSIPIIFVSATAKDQSFSFKGYESGAVDFLLKPLNTHAVKSKVKIFVELYRQRQELNEAKAAAEQANKFKSIFLANMSHEIRTPLGAILGFAELIRDPKINSEDRNRFLEIIYRNGQSLNVIINDVLDLSKIEAGHLTLEYAQTLPRQLGEDVVLLFSANAAKKGLVLEYICEETTPECVVTDPTRVRQILFNLLGNAIKFTQAGSIHVRSYGSITDTGQESLVFEINDTGIGIAKLQWENIFEMFVQADPTVTRRFGGTGLGLALARKLARSLDGDVSLKESTPVGSTFVFRLASHPEKLTSNLVGLETSPVLSDMSQTKILIVDDIPDNVLLFSQHLRKHGVLVDSAEDGRTGYDKTISGNYDLIFMDIQMPEMDGYTAVSRLRKTGYLKPILALSAHAMNEVKQKCLDAGFSGFLSKPVSANELLAAVQRFCGKVKPSETESEVFSVAPELLHSYVLRRTEDLCKLKLSHASNSVEAFNKIGHQMSGSLGSYGLSALEPMAKKMESLSLSELQAVGPVIIEEFSEWLKKFKPASKPE